MLEMGDELDSQFADPVTVGQPLGTGGQGIVYEGRTSAGHPVAIKWYLPAFQQKELRESITTLVDETAPSVNFLWPIDLVTKGDEFGYVMPLRPPNYSNLTMVLGRRVSIKFRELVRAASQTVSAFKALQSKGLFYCDISDANLFVDPATGDILICDNDNVGSSRTRPRVLGTARFMAPEIVRGEKHPSALTDSFSMAILLFLLLMNDHPLQGQAESRIHVFDAAAMRQIYGTKPVFIFDPDNDENRPVPGVHVNAPIFWPLYPQVIRDIFTKVFTHGLRDPGQRPTFGEWQAALAAAEDAIVACQNCGRQNFFCLSHAPKHMCWACRKELQSPLRLVIEGKRVVILNRDTKLYEHHVMKKLGDPTLRGQPRAEVTKHPTRDVLGLKNRGTGQWFVEVPGKEPQTVAPGQSVSLVPGTEIAFGNVRGTIQA